MKKTGCLLLLLMLLLAGKTTARAEGLKFGASYMTMNNPYYQELDALLRQRLHAPVISDIRSSLMDPLYFYATDNHLSTEGAEIHTTQVIDDLRRTLEGEA